MTAIGHRLVAGLGSPHGDDQAGWLVVKELTALWKAEPLAAVRTALTPLDLLDWLDGVDCLHICDACRQTERSDRVHPAGRVHRLVVEHGGGPDHSVSVRGDDSVFVSATPGRGSHDFSLLDVLNLARSTGRLPQRVILWAIPGCRFQPGDAMMPVVRDSAAVVAARIHGELLESA